MRSSGRKALGAREDETFASAMPPMGSFPEMKR